MKIVKMLFLIFAFIVPQFCYAVDYLNDNFDGYSDDPDQHGWIRAHTQVTVEDSTECYSGRCMKIEFIDEGTSAYTLSRDLTTYDTGELYISFYFKRTDHTTGGCKFFKIRALDSDTNYANSTIQMNYTSGDIRGLDQGPCTGLVNDQGGGGLMDSTTTWSDTGTVLVHSPTYTFPDEDWHKFQVYIKLNTDGNKDGEYKIWFDDVLYRHVTDVLNRNDLNPANWTDLYLANYNRFDDGVDPYTLYYDNVVISDTYIGDATTVNLPADSTSTSPAQTTFTATAPDGETISSVTSTHGTVTITSGAGTDTVSGTITNITVNDPSTTLTVTATASDGSTGTDSITISLYEPPVPIESDGYYSLRVGNPGVSVNNGLNVGTGGIFLGGASQDVSCNALLLSDSVNTLLLSDGITALILSK